MRARALADSRHAIGGQAPANCRSASSRRRGSVAILRAPRKRRTAPYASSGAADPKEEGCFPSIPTRPVVQNAPSTCDAATSAAHYFTSALRRLTFVGRRSRAPLATGEPPKKLSQNLSRRVGGGGADVAADQGRAGRWAGRGFRAAAGARVRGRAVGDVRALR